MNRKLKNKLIQEFAAPAPERKEAFFDKLKLPKTGYREFLFSQVHFVRKRVWIASVLVFAFAVAVGMSMKQDFIWMVSACMPILAMSAVTESLRSELYGMSELEKTTTYSLRSIILARMLLIGSLHFILLCLLMILGTGNINKQIILTGLYLTVPYLLTSCGCAWLVGRIRGRDAMYACVGFSVITAVIPLLFRDYLIYLYQSNHLFGWLTAFLLLLGLTVVEYRKLIKRTERFVWNS